MAYRTFHQEKYYDAPDFQGLPHTLQALGTLATIKAQRERQARDLQANSQIGIENGYFPQLQNQINAGALHLSRKLTDHFANGGMYEPAEIKNGKAYLSSLSKSGNTLMNQLKSIQEQIALKKSDDPYWNASNAENELKKAFDPSLDTPEKIQEHLNSVRVGENPKDYDRGKIVSDFVKAHGKTITENSNTSQTGYKKESFNQNQFLNDKGVPEITSDHVKGLLAKHPIMYTSYAEDAQDQIANEIKQARAADEEWTQGKTDEELFSDIYHGKSGNPNAPTIEARDEKGDPIMANGKPIRVPMSFGDRIADMAKGEIAQYEETHNKSTVDASNYQAGARYGITSKAYNPPADGFNQGYLAGPSRMLVKKTGVGDNRMLYIPGSQAEWRYDHDTNAFVKTSKNSAIPFVMTSYQWGPVTAEGKPIPLNATSTDDMLKKIAEMPDAAFGPGAIADVRPIISGRAIDKASVLNLAYNGGKLNEAEEKARLNPDDKNLQNDVSGLHQALDNMQADRAFDSQLIQKYIGTDIVKNQSFATSPDDPNVQAIQGDTQMNIYDPKSLSPDMKLVRNAIKKRIADAAKKKPEAAPQSDEMIAVISPDGKPGKIPASKLDAALKAGFKRK